MADSNRFQFRFVEETVAGTTPATAMQNFRVTSANLKPVNETVTSDEIRPDGQVTDLVRVGVSATAAIGFELSYGLLDKFLEGILRGAWVTDTGLAGVEVGTDLLENSTVAKSYSLEGQFADITQFISLKGARLNQLSLSMQNGQKVTGSLDFIGKIAAIGAATIGTGAPIAAETNDIFTVVDMLGIAEGGGAVELTDLQLQINGNARPQQALGSAALRGIGLGLLNVTGSIEAYFTSAALYKKYIDMTASSLAWALGDAAGNQLAFSLPRIKYSDGDVNVQGNSQDVMVALPFQALMDPVTGKTIRLARTAA